jgi:hypothetical protein
MDHPFDDNLKKTVQRIADTQSGGIEALIKAYIEATGCKADELCLCQQTQRDKVVFWVEKRENLGNLPPFDDEG